MATERGNGTTTKRVDPSTKLRRGSTHSIERLAARRQTGKEADKLAKIVDKYLPDVSRT